MLGLCHDSSRSLRGQKAGIWTRCYALSVEKGNIEQRRSQKGFGMQLKMALQFWILKNIRDGTNIRIRSTLGEYKN